MYKQDHYHSTTHEVLVVVSTTGARLRFGGGRSDLIVQVGKGDVIVVPAGVGHSLITELPQNEDKRDGFKMIGSYPVGSDHWDMCTDEMSGQDKDEAWERVRKLGWFEKDPVYGVSGLI
jgi:uncharacterized protein YjlB